MQRISRSPQDTFELGREIGASLHKGDVVLLYGGLGAGKTLLTKGILDALQYDTDEVTSPTFALVNLYNTPRFDVYHVDLWRVEEGHDPVTAVGLDEIVGGDSVTIIEWADRLGEERLVQDPVKIKIAGDGDEPRKIHVLFRHQASEYLIEVRKSDRKLDLFLGDALVGTYDIALGPSPDGQKQQEGDGRTPEGEYFIFAKNPKSKHHLSLAISYPDIAAVEAGFAAGTIDQNTRDRIVHDLEECDWIPQETPLGGKIYIHGGGTDRDWTDGCIALQDNDIEEIFELVPVGTSVTIHP